MRKELPPLDKVNPPQQVRSRERMEKVLTAFAALLEEKDFDKITISELSRRAGATPPSIYARFADKGALLLAAHERFKISTETRIIKRIADATKTGESPDEFLMRIADFAAATYASNRFILRAVLFANNESIYTRIGMLAQSLEQAVYAWLEPRLELDKKELRRRLRLGLQSVAALGQQHVIFAGHDAPWYPLSASELAQHMRATLQAHVLSAQHAKPSARRKKAP